MSDPPLPLLQSIHASGVKLVYEFTGAGALALAWLHSIGGSSRTILEATDRYSAASLTDLLGAMPAKKLFQNLADAPHVHAGLGSIETVSKSVCPPSATAMAAAAHLRAVRLAPDAPRRIGVGCTATIATDYAKRGDHACYVAVHDGSGVHGLGLKFRKGARDRMGEETIVALLVLRAIAAACGIAPPAPLDLLPGEQLEESRALETDPIRMLLHGAVRWVAVSADGTITTEPPVRGVILSGSFNPLHEGHLALGLAASQCVGQPLILELPIVNADKPPLSEAEITRRVAQFRGRCMVVLTREPLFLGKAELFPGCAFAIGYDTAQRVLGPRYYGSEAARDAALAAIAQRGCRFIVAGRAVEGAFHTLADVPLPLTFKDLFIELPDFRRDISSTALRARGG